MSTPHRFLVVEDDETTGEELRSLLSALGHECSVVANREDAVALVECEPVCLVILDLEIPNDSTSPVGLPEAGLSLLDVIRRRYPEVSGTNGHTLQVIVYSAHGGEAPNVHEAMQRGANAVVRKVPGSRSGLKREIEAALARSGRPEHGFCDEPPRQPVLPAYFEGAQLDALGGHYRGNSSRNEIFINNRALGLANEPFGFLVQLISGRLHNKEGWVDRSTLGPRARETSYQTPSRLRKALEQHVPEGLDPIEVDGGRFRLSPRVGLREVRWAALKNHPEALVRSAADLND